MLLVKALTILTWHTFLDNFTAQNRDYRFHDRGLSGITHNSKTSILARTVSFRRLPARHHGRQRAGLPAETSALAHPTRASSCAVGWERPSWAPHPWPASLRTQRLSCRCHWKSHRCKPGHPSPCQSRGMHGRLVGAGPSAAPTGRSDPNPPEVRSGSASTDEPASDCEGGGSPGVGAVTRVATRTTGESSATSSSWSAQHARLSPSGPRSCGAHYQRVKTPKSFCQARYGASGLHACADGNAQREQPVERGRTSGAQRPEGWRCNWKGRPQAQQPSKPSKA